MSFIALNSAEEMKSEKKRVGAIANNSAIPPVSAKLIYTYFILSFRILGYSVIFFKANIAIRGIVNSAMTRIEATVLNFEYMGI